MRKEGRFDLARALQLWYDSCTSRHRIIAARCRTHHLSTETVEVGSAEMNVHAIATLFIVIGLILVLSCVLQAEICYRQVKRYLEHNRETRERTATRYSATEREG
jgi:hypothetical protein